MDEVGKSEVKLGARAFASDRNHGACHWLGRARDFTRLLLYNMDSHFLFYIHSLLRAMLI